MNNLFEVNSNNLFAQVDNRFEVELPKNQEQEEEKVSMETTIDTVLEAFKEFLPTIVFVVHKKIRKGQEKYEEKEMELQLIRQDLDQLKKKQQALQRFIKRDNNQQQLKDAMKMELEKESPL